MNPNDNTWWRGTFLARGMWKHLWKHLAAVWLFENRPELSNNILFRNALSSLMKTISECITSLNMYQAEMLHCCCNIFGTEKWKRWAESPYIFVPLSYPPPPSLPTPASCRTRRNYIKKRRSRREEKASILCMYTYLGGSWCKLQYECWFFFFFT